MNTSLFNDLMAKVSAPIPTCYERRSANPDCWDMDTMLTFAENIGRGFDPKFSINADNRHFYAQLMYWVMADTRMMAQTADGKWINGRVNRGLFIAGPTGSGKTTAVKILRKICYYNVIGLRMYDERGERIWGWWQKRADELSALYAKEGSEGLISAKTEALVSIDDIGCEPAETNFMGTKVNVIRQIVEARSERRGLMIITSNYGINDEEMVERYGDRVVSRLTEMCNFLILDTNDHRHEIAERGS